MTKMFSKFQKATDKARKALSGARNSSIFPVCFRRHSTMVEQKQASSAKVQALYDLCKKTFPPSGPSPPPQAVQKLCSVLDTISAADVGLKEEDPDADRGHGFFGFQQLTRTAGWAKPITYIDVYDCDNFTICIFCFPTSSVIPLHDHPGMTVFSKVLYGSLHVKGYDWVDPGCIQESKGPDCPPVRLAKLSVDKVLTAPCETSVLYPKSGGNLHCFTSLTPCAVLDVLTPPYQEDAGRRCTYYHDYSYSASSSGKGSEIGEGKVDDYAWLAEIDTPDSLYMHSGVYRGPVIHM